MYHTSYFIFSYQVGLKVKYFHVTDSDLPFTERDRSHLKGKCFDPGSFHTAKFRDILRGGGGGGGTAHTKDNI